MRMAGFWPPLMLTRPIPLSWEIFGARRVSMRSSTCEQRDGIGGDGQGEDRSVGRIDLAVDGRRRQIGRQKALRRR